MQPQPAGAQTLSGARPGFAVRYLAGRKDVTKLVEKGTYKTAKLAAGRTVTLQLVLTVRAKVRKAASWAITATSLGRGAHGKATVRLTP